MLFCYLVFSNWTYYCWCVHRPRVAMGSHQCKFLLLSLSSWKHFILLYFPNTVCPLRIHPSFTYRVYCSCCCLFVWVGLGFIINCLTDFNTLLWKALAILRYFKRKGNKGRKSSIQFSIHVHPGKYMSAFCNKR